MVSDQFTEETSTLTTIIMRRPQVDIGPWASLRADLELLFRRIAARTIFPEHSQTEVFGFENIRFEEIEEASDFELTFEIIFKGEEMRRRLTLERINRLRDIFMYLIKSGPAIKRYPGNILVEVYCH